MSVMASAKARLSSLEYVPSTQYTFHSGISPPSLFADGAAHRLRCAGMPVTRCRQVLDEPVTRRRSGLFEKCGVGVEVTAVKGEQLLGLRGGFVNLALSLGEGAYVVFGEDHQQRLGCDIGKPARGLELDEIL